MLREVNAMSGLVDEDSIRARLNSMKGNLGMLQGHLNDLRTFVEAIDGNAEGSVQSAPVAKESCVLAELQSVNSQLYQSMELAGSLATRLHTALGGRQSA